MKISDKPKVDGALPGRRSNGWGGKREGAGRNGNPLKSQRLAFDLIARQQERIKDNIGEEGCLTPLEYFLAIMWNPAEERARRDKAAEVCLPYIHPKLQSIQVKQDDESKITVVLQSMTKDGVTNTMVTTSNPSIPTQVALASSIDADD